MSWGGTSQERKRCKALPWGRNIPPKRERAARPGGRALQKTQAKKAEKNGGRRAATWGRPYVHPSAPCGGTSPVKGEAGNGPGRWL